MAVLRDGGLVAGHIDTTLIARVAAGRSVRIYIGQRIIQYITVPVKALTTTSAPAMTDAIASTLLRSSLTAFAVGGKPASWLSILSILCHFHGLLFATNAE